MVFEEKKTYFEECKNIMYHALLHGHITNNYTIFNKMYSYLGEQYAGALISVVMTHNGPHQAKMVSYLLQHAVCKIPSCGSEHSLSHPTIAILLIAKMIVKEKGILSHSDTADKLHLLHCVLSDIKHKEQDPVTVMELLTTDCAKTSPSSFVSTFMQEPISDDFQPFNEFLIRAPCVGESLDSL
jgi:hypothetical protein